METEKNLNLEQKVPGLEQKVPGEPDKLENQYALAIELASKTVVLLAGKEGANLLITKVINVLQALKEAQGAEEFVPSTLDGLIGHLAVRIVEKSLNLDWVLNIMLGNVQLKYEKAQNQESGQPEETITLGAGDGTHKIRFKIHHGTFVQIN